MKNVILISIVGILGLIVSGCGSTKPMLPVREIDRPLTLPKKVWQSRGSINGNLETSNFQDILFPSYGITNTIQIYSLPFTGIRWQFLPFHQPDSTAIDNSLYMAIEAGNNTFININPFKGAHEMYQDAELLANKMITNNKWIDGSLKCTLSRGVGVNNVTAYPLYFMSNLGFQITDNFYLKSGLLFNYENLKGAQMQNNTYGRFYEIGFPQTLGFNVSSYFSLVMNTSLLFLAENINQEVHHLTTGPTSISLVFQW
jgi:hypothetical protein